MIYVNDKGFITTTKELTTKEKENGYLIADLSKPVRRESLEEHLRWNTSIQKEKDIVYMFTAEGNIKRLVAWKRYDEKAYHFKAEMNQYVKQVFSRTLASKSGLRNPTEMKNIGYNKYLIYFR